MKKWYKEEEYVLFVELQFEKYKETVMLVRSQEEKNKPNF